MLNQSWLIFLILFLATQLSSQPGRASTFSDQELEKASEELRWLQLLKYERDLSGFFRRRSGVKSVDFFFSDKGYKDPKAEMVANLKAIALPPSKDINKHAICLFPARYKWLITKFPQAERKGFLQKCTHYQGWRHLGRIESISLYFATGYFGNPASFFGHPLMRFNTTEKVGAMFDPALNYGALTPDQENPIAYVMRGLFGGYYASFSDLHYFQHDHNYAEVDLRDLWEYRLNLKPDEVDLIVDHSWEMLGRKIPYRFLADNCALRFAELLEMAYGVDLVERHDLYSIPIILFEKLGLGKRNNGEPLVSFVKKSPSRMSRLSDKLTQLNGSESRALKDVVNEANDFSQSSYKELSQKSQARVLETLVDYYSTMEVKDKGSAEKYKELRKAPILKRLELPPGGSDFKDIDEPPPHSGQRSFTLQVGNTWGKEITDAQFFRVRPALYDLLSPSVVGSDNSSLNIFDTKLYYYDSQVFLTEMRVIDVTALNIPKVKLPGLGGVSWKMAIGFEQLKQTCFDCTVAFAQAGVGYTLSLFSWASLYGMVTGRVQNNLQSYGTLAATPEVGTLVRVSSWFKFISSVSYQRFVNSGEADRWRYETEARLGPGKQWDFRLRYIDQEEKQFTLGVSWYL